jgi:small-conductance mechanosensitive channel
MAGWFAGVADWVLGWGLIAAAALLGGVLYATIYRVIGAVGRRRPEILLLEGSFLRNSQSGMRLLIPLFAIRLSLPLASRYLAESTIATLRTLLAVLFVLAITWLAIRLTKIMEEVTARKFDIGVEDNLRARRVKTRVGLLRRILVIGIGIVGLGLLMLQIPGFRTIGTGPLASAGVIGIIVGVAAQRPLANLLAGLQIALTQPFRVEDAVIVEGEWGWIEEITLTYVVVRLWDLRRLVLPISYFLEKPFQNWTRTSASLLGSAFIFTDYTVPVEELRRELERIVRETPLWDGNVCVLQVTDLTERAVQLRALVSASNAPRAWDLRCFVREKLIAFLQQKYPESLPKLRLAPEAESSERSPGEGRPDWR